ncbi:hypothetical protein BB558_006686 [Smittium angustum]|uniref:Uncharacterized protein n=1 Tax=Smittium angustum TaxID=133377 RepID=A0A2U1IX08_SMIAN|nr:hypothetical protein BB558_006686 [Smittium angustum]
MLHYNINQSSISGKQKKSKKSEANSEDEIIDLVQVSGHKLQMFRSNVETSARSENKKYDSNDNFIPIGSSGKNKSFNLCISCSRFRKKRAYTKHFCSECKTAVCNTNNVWEDLNGKMFICWNRLHEDESLIESAERKKFGL